MKINVRCGACFELLKIEKAETNNCGDEVDLFVDLRCKCITDLEDKIDMLQEEIDNK